MNQTLQTLRRASIDWRMVLMASVLIVIAVFVDQVYRRRVK